MGTLNVSLDKVLK